MEYTNFATTLAELPKIAKQDGEPAALRKFETALDEIAEIRRDLSPAEEVEHIDAFRRAGHHLMLQSEFNYYVFARPRGYPGDFMTQDIIWNGRTKGGEDRYRGISEIGKMITALSLDMAAPRANELRMHRLAGMLSENKYQRVASIGCGPAIEYTLLDGPLPEDVFLLDQDEEALACARANERFSEVSATFCEENIVKFILQNSRRRHIGDRDLIYAFGLFDYFPVKLAQRVVAALWVSVVPGGKILVTNAHPDNPTRLWMEWAGEWYLDYKTKEEMHAIAEGLEGVASVTYDIDECGVYQYLEIQKEA